MNYQKQNMVGFVSGEQVQLHQGANLQIKRLLKTLLGALLQLVIGPAARIDFDKPGIGGAMDKHLDFLTSRAKGCTQDGMPVNKLLKRDFQITRIDPGQHTNAEWQVIGKGCS